MRSKLIISTLLSATMLASTAAPSLSGALNANPLKGERTIVWSIAGDAKAADGESVLLAQPEIEAEDTLPRNPGDNRDGPRRVRHGLDLPGPFGPNHDAYLLGLDLAAGLAAAETYVGITPEQFPAWRTYTSALIDFFERSNLRPIPFGPPHAQPDATSNTGDHPREPAPIFAVRLAEEAIAQGEKAKALRAAVEELRSVLRPDQLGRLANADRTMILDLHPRGPMEGVPDEHGPRGELPPPSWEDELPEPRSE